jgi:hypothetical protein
MYSSLASGVAGMPGMIQQRWLTIQRYFSLVPYLSMFTPWCILFYDVWAKPFYTSSHADSWAFSDPLSYTIHLWIMNLPYFRFIFLFFDGYRGDHPY